MKKITKITAVVLSLVLLMTSFFTISVNAADVTYSVTDVSGKKGDTVTVSVNISSSVNLWGGIVKLGYNSSELQYVSSDKGTVISSGSLNNSGSSVTYAGQYNGKNGTVFTVTFKILKDSGYSTLTLTSSENIDGDGKEYTCSTSNGKVTVSKASGILGDVNESGFVNALDARHVLQYVVGEKELSANQLALADMNGDGKVTTIDARCILKKVVS